MSTIVEVSAAALLRRGGTEFLLAQRPQGKVYAGYWEFPGGKVERGETAHQALARELREELGVIVEQAWPWLCREFSYPHADVRLRFFRIEAWQGTIAPLEHSAFAWLTVGATPQVEPILPANGPILQALALPSVYALTNAEENGVPAELARLERALAGGLQLIQLRDKTLPSMQRRQLAEAIIIRAGQHPNVRVLINDDPGLALSVGAHGVHFSSRKLWQLDRRPACGLVAASCHTAADLARAAELALDFVVLGPVLPTASHPAASAIGWPEFARLIERSPLPVYALGGLRPSMLDGARRYGAHGIAALRGWAPA